MNNSSINKTQQRRLPMLGWLAMPMVAILLVVNYAIGKVQGGYKPVYEDVIKQALVEPSSQPKPLDPSKGAITLWFDDAWLTQYETGFYEVSERGWKAVLAVPTKLVGNDAYMTWTQIRRVRYAGWQIVSHSQNHICDRDKLDLKTITQELVMSQNDLATEGLPTNDFVAPCGVVTPAMNDIAKSVYRSMRGSEEGLNPVKGTNKFDLKIHVLKDTTTIQNVRDWLNESRQNKEWLNLVFHQIGEAGGEYQVSKQMFYDIMNEIADSKLQVVLAAQVFEQ